MGTSPSSRLRELVRNGRSFSGRERNCCYLNTGSAQFADVSAVSGVDFPDDGRGVAVTDWDGDGRLDFWVVNRNGPQVRFLHNRVADSNHFLALRLQGTTCNRDAIGARVEVLLADEEVPGRKLMKTLRAGESFISQSSKWLHFGLGKNQQVKSVAVRWPGGEVEVITDVAADRHYRVVQGEGRAVLDRQRGSRQVGLKTASLTPAQASDAFRVFLASRLPLPRLTVITADGEQSRWFSRSGSQEDQPILLNIWASWCQPCIKELKKFSEREEDFRQAGLKVLALNVNRSTQDRTLSSESAAIVQRLGIPFEVGVAPQETIEKLQLVNNAIFTRYLPLPVPCSLLVDGDGQLAAIYRGPVSVDQLLQDVRSLNSNKENQQSASLPFTGRRLASAGEAKPLGVVEELLAQEHLAEALAYADRARRWWPGDREFPLLLVRLGDQLLTRGDAADAEHWFRESLRLDETYKTGRTGLAMALDRQGRVAEAIEEFKAVLRRYPDNLTTLNNLAWLLATRAALDEDARSEAIELANRAAQLTDYQNGSVLDTLAAAYASDGQFAKAAKIASEAIEMMRSNGDSAAAAEVEQRLDRYQNSQSYRR